MLTHRQLVTVSRQIARALAVDDRDVTLAVAPWFHILGLTAELLVPLTCGATVVTMPASTRRRSSTCSSATGSPTSPGRRRWRASSPATPAWRPTTCATSSCSPVGGAPLPAATHEALARRLPGCAVGQGWGLTETSGAICIPTRRRRLVTGHRRTAAAEHRAPRRRPRDRPGARTGRRRRAAGPRAADDARLPPPPRRDGGDDHRRRVGPHRRSRPRHHRRPTSWSSTG